MKDMTEAQKANELYVVSIKGIKYLKKFERFCKLLDFFQRGLELSEEIVDWDKVEDQCNLGLAQGLMMLARMNEDEGGRGITLNFFSIIGSEDGFEMLRKKGYIITVDTVEEDLNFYPLKQQFKKLLERTDPFAN